MYDAVVFKERVYCLDCCPESARNPEDESCPIDPIFKGTEWGYVPQCCSCGKKVEVKVVKPPALSMPRGLHVLNTQSLEIGEIVNWAFGPFITGYSYQVRSAEDGELVIWHDSVISTHINTLRWKD